MRKIIAIICFTLFCFGCTSTKQTIGKSIDASLKGPFYDNQFTGLLIIDAETKDTLYNLNSSKYFTPASNTKIFTLYTAMQALPKQVPSLKYAAQNDTLYFEGSGDPSFLHPYLKDSTAYHFLKQHTHLAFVANNFPEDRFGPGWSWDDFHWYYSPERNAFPLYGNVVSISNKEGVKVAPAYFQDSVVTVSNSVNREENKNIFYFDPIRTDTLEVPYKTSPTTTLRLLEALLEKPIAIAKQFPALAKKILYGMETDSLYRRLMVESDNFIAEQLLILSASVWQDTLNSELAREYVLKNHLPDLPQKPRWVDGSGLSRYNLFTPQSIVYVLNELLEEVPKERLFQLFPAGGISGTLTDWYGNATQPYLYAKSGSLGNNYCLSGYLLTKSDKTLIFSFMNNHFTQPSSEVKKHMETIFEEIRDRY